MPETALRNAAGTAGFGEVRFAQLAIDLQVSPSALAWRLKSLNLIDGITHTRFKDISGKRAAALSDATATLIGNATRSRAHRPPGLLARDTFAAYERGLTTLRLHAQVLSEPDIERLRASLEGNGGATSRRRRPSADEIRSFFADEVKAPL